MDEAPKKLLPIHRLLDKLSNARAMVCTVEMALATIDRDETPEAAEDVRRVAYMARNRLRKIEKHLYAHHHAELRKAFPEAPGHD
jgi:hypothetical protein